MNDDAVKFSRINDPNSFDMPKDVNIVVRPGGSETRQSYSWQFLMANLSASHSPFRKRANHRRAELRRLLGAARYREHVAGNPIRGQSRLWHIYDEMVAFKEAATDYLIKATGIDAERIARQYPAMPEPK